MDGLVEKAEFLRTKIQDYRVFHFAFPADSNERTCWTSYLCESGNGHRSNQAFSLSGIFLNSAAFPGGNVH